MWQEPVFDRTDNDTIIARASQSTIDNHKGALNYQDLNRIEDNYKYLLARLASNDIHIPHAYRNYEETTIETVDVETEYTPVEYIESSGTQYIDTGFKPNQDTRVVLDADVLATNVSGAIQIISVTDGTNYFVLRINAEFTAYQARRGTGALFTISHSGNLYGRHLFDLNKSIISVDGVETVDSERSYSIDYSIYIGTQNNKGSTTGKAALKIYSCQIYDNGILIRDFIPVKDASSIACLYDKVTKAYFYNAGTGVFTAGEELTPETKKETIEVKQIYTDWQEENIPWKSEIDRIRDNYNNLVELFLINLGLPVLTHSQYVMYTEVNDWERIAYIGKQMFENMEKEYIPCGTIDSGGDRLL